MALTPTQTGVERFKGVASLAKQRKDTGFVFKMLKSDRVIEEYEERNYTGNREGEKET